MTARLFRHHSARHVLLLECANPRVQDAKLRLSFVTKSLGAGGTETHLLDFLPSLKSQGFELAVFCFTERDCAPACLRMKGSRSSPRRHGRRGLQHDQGSGQGDVVQAPRGLCARGGRRISLAFRDRDAALVRLRFSQSRAGI